MVLHLSCNVVLWTLNYEHLVDYTIVQILEIPTGYIVYYTSIVGSTFYYLLDFRYNTVGNLEEDINYGVLYKL